MKFKILLLSIIFITGCLQEDIPCAGTQYTIKPGKHAARPITQMFGDFEGLAYEYQFNESWRYTLPAADQKDWNKLGGISLDPFTNHNNSAMWSIRYDPQDDELEYGIYCHVNGQRVIRQNPDPLEGKDSEAWITTPVDGKVICRMRRWPVQDIITIELETSDVVVTAVQEYDNVPNNVREIGTWFGGNNAAPHRITYIRTGECN